MRFCSLLFAVILGTAAAANLGNAQPKADGLVARGADVENLNAVPQAGAPLPGKIAARQNTRRSVDEAKKIFARSCDSDNACRYVCEGSENSMKCCNGDCVCSGGCGTSGNPHSWQNGMCQSDWDCGSVCSPSQADTRKCCNGYCSCEGGC